MLLPYYKFHTAVSVGNCSECCILYVGLDFVFLNFHSVFFVIVFYYNTLYIFCMILKGCRFNCYIHLNHKNKNCKKCAVVRFVLQ
jgi:hypothetical protein